MILKSKKFKVISLFRNEFYSSSAAWYGDNTQDTIENALFYASNNFDTIDFEIAIFDRFGNYYPIKK